MTDSRDALDVVYQFTHDAKLYRIVTIDSFPWRKAFGFKPKFPYILVSESGYGINGVSESDLVWYRQNR
jgi:hypothetical protein